MEVPGAPAPPSDRLIPYQRSIAALALCAWPSLAVAEVDGSWSGALRVGGGATVHGSPAPTGVELGLRLGGQAGPAWEGRLHYEQWAAGAFVELHTLGFERFDVVGGLAFVTPAIKKAFTFRLDAGGGYSFAAARHISAPELLVTLWGGFRGEAPHQTIVIGPYVSARVFFTGDTAVAVTGGLEIDPVGFVRAFFSMR
jgi:hypothetical protein